MEFISITIKVRINMDDKDWFNLYKLNYWFIYIYIPNSLDLLIILL